MLPARDLGGDGGEQRSISTDPRASSSSSQGLEPSTENLGSPDPYINSPGTHTATRLLEQRDRPRTLSQPTSRSSSHRGLISRSSFESVREAPSSLAQSFVSRKQSVTPSQKSMAATEALFPSSVLHRWLPDRPLESHLDFESQDLAQHESIESDPFPDQFAGIPIDADGSNGFPHDSRSGIERLPLELLEPILSQLLLDVPPTSYTPRNEDLMACLLTCRTLHLATVNVLYRHVTIPHSRIFSKMLQQISAYPGLGALVKRLDFSHYTSIGSGRTRRDNFEIKNVVPETLVQCLQLMPGLREFLVHEHMDDELDQKVLSNLFALPKLEAVDFCACSSRLFTQSLEIVVSSLPSQLPQLSRLSLHECSTLQGPALESLLSHLPNLTHLDVYHTLISNSALLSIQPSARLTHLNLGKCTQLSGSFVTQFLLTHPSTRNLHYLSLMSDPRRHRLLSSADLSTLLPALPSTLYSLNINGSSLSSSHLPLLLPLTKHLEELSISHCTLTTYDLNSFFRPPVSPYLSASPDSEPSPPTSNLRYLDITSCPHLSTTRVALFAASSLLLSAASQPLQVIEISDEDLIAGLRSRYSKPNNGIGWIVQELGRRAWLVRDEGGGGEDNHGKDDGARPWKMGARWWGMRKVPVVKAEVGGMYGYFMFKC